MSSFLLWVLNVLRDGLPIPTNYIQLLKSHAGQAFSTIP
jgi:hypothetical protein